MAASSSASWVTLVSMLCVTPCIAVFNGVDARSFFSAVGEGCGTGRETGNGVLAATAARPVSTLVEGLLDFGNREVYVVVVVVVVVTAASAERWIPVAGRGDLSKTVR